MISGFLMIRIGTERKLKSRRIKTGDKVHALRWEFYMKDNNELIKRKCLVEDPHRKGGEIFLYPPRIPFLGLWGSLLPGHVGMGR